MLLFLRFSLPFVLFGVGCSSTPVVSQYGGMKDTLKMGNTQPRVTFDEITSTPHAIAVGALPDLQGEITIFDGHVWVATTDGKKATTFKATPPYDSATLLTASHVDVWSEYALPPSMDLEQAIEYVASNVASIDTSKPFPFFIMGEASEFHMHVINGYCPVASPDLGEEFLPWRLAATGTPITVVGFFAKNQEGIMTHHGSNVHIHGFLDVDGAVATGHLDSVTLMNGARLFLPAS